MNQTGPDPTTAGGDRTPPPGFDASRVRTVATMRRSSTDRLLGGVCGGAGRHLGIDPVVLRVAIGVLAIVGGAGVILYVAFWLLVASDDAPRSPVAQWLDLGQNEQQVRQAGLVVAGVLAALAALGDVGSGIVMWPFTDFAWPFVWLLAWVGVPVVAVYWFFVVRPRRDRQPHHPQEGTTMSAPPPPGPVDAPPAGWPAAPAPTAGSVAPPVASTTQWPPADVPPGPPPGPPSAQPAGGPRRARRPFSWALTLLTLSVALIACAVTYLVVGSDASVSWASYAAVALGVTALGLLVGTVVGNAGPLIPVGLLLVLTLMVGAVVPNLSAGDARYTPTSAADVRSEYGLGMGRLTLDLSDVADASSLEGRTIQLDHGLGETVVVVPRDVEVALDADLLAGQVELDGRRWDGTMVDVTERTSPTGPALTLDVDQSLGQVRVVRR